MATTPPADASLATTRAPRTVGTRTGPPGQAMGTRRVSRRCRRMRSFSGCRRATSMTASAVNGNSAYGFRGQARRGEVC
nr:unnamed protein product [Digitaria exilis]